jgi:asparagine synthase (glutamine-hydrolysing)
MCGITGYIDFQRKTTTDVLQKMTDSLEHRGPDGSGIWEYQHDHFSLGFGHRRLAIIELSELGAQPMHWQDYTIVFNGEIYNFREIRSELETLGHQFQSDSDTEMILHAYQQWGHACLNRFIGMFAIVIFNRNTHELFIARDRAGIKPLFVYEHNGLVLFASELKAFHEHPRFTKQLSIPAVHAFMQFGSVPTPHCIFKHCIKVEPGHYVETRIGEQFKFKQQPYWSVYTWYNLPKLDCSEQEAKVESEKLLVSACNYRMVADVPVGVFLSGGYDSTAVTALLQKDRTERLRTYTIAVPDIGLNEAAYSKRTAEILGTQHTEYTCTAQEAIELIADLPYYYDEPFADSSAIPTTLVSKIARKEVTVALSADAGDEVFGGYNRYEMILKYGQQLNKIPSFARKGLASVMDWIPASSIPVLREKYNFAQRYEKTKSILSDTSSRNILLSLSKLFTDEQIRELVKDPFMPLSTYYDNQELSEESPLSFAMAMDYKTYLLDDILQKVDRASMSVSLESREPLLDHRLLEYVATGTVKRNGCSRKLSINMFRKRKWTDLKWVLPFRLRAGLPMSCGHK